MTEPKSNYIKSCKYSKKALKLAFGTYIWRLSSFEQTSSLQKSSLEFWEFRLERARTLPLFTSILKLSSSLGSIPFLLDTREPKFIKPEP